MKDLEDIGGISPLVYENCDIAIAMSSSRADPVLGLYILSYCPCQGYLNMYINQCHCPDLKVVLH